MLQHRESDPDRPSQSPARYLYATAAGGINEKIMITLYGFNSLNAQVHSLIRFVVESYLFICTLVGFLNNHCWAVTCFGVIGALLYFQLFGLGILVRVQCPKFAKGINLYSVRF